MTDEELVTTIKAQAGIDMLENKNTWTTTDAQDELLSRLTKGQRAIEAMEKIVKASINANFYMTVVEGKNVLNIVREWEANNEL